MHSFPLGPVTVFTLQSWFILYTTTGEQLLVNMRVSSSAKRVSSSAKRVSSSAKRVSSSAKACFIISKELDDSGRAGSALVRIYWEGFCLLEHSLLASKFQQLGN